MEQWAVGANSEHELIQELRNCKDPKREVEIVDKLEKLQEAEVNTVAFAETPNQQEYIKACSYSDVWVKLRDRSGKTVVMI